PTTIHVDFDELTLMASEQSNSGPALHEVTPATISSGLVPKPTSSTPFVPPSRTDWDFLFQLLFDELLTPLPSVDHPAPEVIAPIPEVVTPELAATTGSPSSTTVDQGLVDLTLVIPRNENDLLLVQFYVDDIIFAASTPELGIFIKQSKYAIESLKKYDFEYCDLVDTPMVEKSKLDGDKEGKAVDSSHYYGMIGTLLYLTASRPDL
nr:retrovirus-related Pol polyprotein from transposon TNT 1-94 [Tanacetum cinerariifolium]